MFRQTSCKDVLSSSSFMSHSSYGSNLLARPDSSNSSYLDRLVFAYQHITRPPHRLSRTFSALQVGLSALSFFIKFITTLPTSKIHFYHSPAGHVLTLTAIAPSNASLVLLTPLVNHCFLKPPVKITVSHPPSIVTSVDPDDFLYL